ncbi:MAG: sigma-54-dependent Fis family transcriptional regulator [Magnetococcales bacterium]|nr:sigma-54-dependent Fis family transcriptional regulator [Magnetococcales bacterium]
MPPTPAPPAAPAVVLVDDDPDVLALAGAILEKAGIRPVITLARSADLFSLLERQETAVVVLDLFMPEPSGLQLLPELSQRHPAISVILLTASQELEVAVGCMKLGAFDYLLKPVEKNRLLASVRSALKIYSLQNQVDFLKQSLFTPDQSSFGNAFNGIITGSSKMWSLFRYILSVAPSKEPVLISGETGTGKELLARAVHLASGRPGQLVTVNVAGLDDHVFSDTLFGHVRGAFTGAEAQREGLIARAAHGTLFLDEIGDLSEVSQIKLLRLLQDNEYYPLGSDAQKHATARIVLATNRDLRQRIEDGKFRMDLYYRLSVHEIRVPPLRDRREDLPLLVDHLIAEAAKSMGKPPPTPPRELISLLNAYEFPGNVRELRAILYDAVAKHKSRMLSLDGFRKLLPTRGRGSGETARGAGSIEGEPQIALTGRFPTFKEAEELLIEEAMRRSDDNQGIAASLLGVSRQALNRRLMAMSPRKGTKGKG